jgi:outer membrane protein TolC
MTAVTAVTLLAIAMAQAQGETPSAALTQPDLAPQPPAAAQPAGEVITLEQALKLAAERNLDLKATRAQLKQADEISVQAWSSYLPQVTGSGTYTRNQPSAVLPAGTFGEGSPEVTLVAKDQIAGQVEANQVIFSPALAFGIRAATKAEDFSRLTIENVRRDIIFGVAQAYYGVAALKEAVEVSERLLEIAQRQEKDARIRYQAGAIAKVGLLRAEIDRARAEQDLRRAKNSYESARIGLATLLDRPVDFEVAAPPEPRLPEPLGELEQVALRERLDLQAARRNVESQRASRNATYGRYFPNVAAFGRYQVQNAAGFTGQDYSWAFGLGLSWTLLDGGLRESQVRVGTARIVEAEASADSLEARVSAQVRQSILDLESARANAAKAKEQRDLAAENQRLVDVSYRAGAATAVEQADATAQLRNAEIAVTTESLSAQLAAVRLLQVAGEFDPLRRTARPAGAAPAASPAQ